MAVTDGDDMRPPTLTWRLRHSVHAIVVRLVRTMGLRRLGSNASGRPTAAGR